MESGGGRAQGEKGPDCLPHQGWPQCFQLPLRLTEVPALRFAAPGLLAFGLTMKNRVLFLFFEAICVVVLFAAIIVALNFISAETPGEAIARGIGVVPNGCEAVVYEGGRYFCWYKLSMHPILFALDVFVALAADRMMAWLLRKSLAD